MINIVSSVSENSYVFISKIMLFTSIENMLSNVAGKVCSRSLEFYFPRDMYYEEDLQIFLVSVKTIRELNSILDQDNFI